MWPKSHRPAGWSTRGVQGVAGPAPPWSPLNLTGLLSWHRADLGVTGSPVSAWANQSGVPDPNRNALQGVPADQPTLNASDPAFAGKPTISFAAGTAKRLVTGIYSVAPTFPYTVIMIGIKDGGAYLWDNRAGAQVAGVALGNVFNSYAGTGFLECTGSNVSVASVTIAVMNSFTSSVEANHIGPISGNPGSTLSTGFTIGGNCIVSAGSGSRIAEFIVMNAAITAGEKTNLYAYALAQYGIP